MLHTPPSCSHYKLLTILVTMSAVIGFSPLASLASLTFLSVYGLLSYSLFFFLMIRPPPSSPLFPYTTLFRSQLHHVQAFEICQLRLVARLDQGLEPGLHQRGESAAEHRLLAEEIGLGFLFEGGFEQDRKSTRLNSSHLVISYAVFCLKKKTDD